MQVIKKPGLDPHYFCLFLGQSSKKEISVDTMECSEWDSEKTCLDFPKEREKRGPLLCEHKTLKKIRGNIYSWNMETPAAFLEGKKSVLLLWNLGAGDRFPLFWGKTEFVLRILWQQECVPLPIYCLRKVSHYSQTKSLPRDFEWRLNKGTACTGFSIPPEKRHQKCLKLNHLE